MTNHFLGLVDNNVGNAPAQVLDTNSTTGSDIGEPPEQNDFFQDLIDDFFEGLHLGEEPPPLAPDAWTADDGRQKPLVDLTPQVRDAMWNYASVQGARIKGLLGEPLQRKS